MPKYDTGNSSITQPDPDATPDTQSSTPDASPNDDESPNDDASPNDDESPNDDASSDDNTSPNDDASLNATAAHASEQFYEQQITAAVTNIISVTMHTPDNEPPSLTVVVGDALARFTLKEKLTTKPANGGLDIPLLVTVTVDRD